MSNGSPQHDGQQQGQPGYRYGEYNEYGEFVEYPDYGTEGGGYPTGDFGTYGHGHDYGQGQQHQQGRQVQQHQQAAQHSYGQQHGAYPSYPTGGWGGESDADATAFVQLPAGPLPPPGAPADAWGPLAAPGTGRGAYTPPPLDPNEVAGHGGEHHQPPAAQYGAPVAGDEGPGAGQWAMPFGEGTTLGGGWSPTAYEEYAQQYGQQSSPQGVEDVPGSGLGSGAGSGQHPVPGAEPGGDDDGHGQGPGQGSGPGQGPGGLPTGQGAAAALAGSHEARTRRPLGTRGGAAADETEPIGNTGQFSFPAAPQQSQPPEPSAEAHYAEAHARRRIQVPSEERHEVPGTAEAYAQPSAPSDPSTSRSGTPEDEAASSTPAAGTAVEAEGGPADTPDERSAETSDSMSGPGSEHESAPAGDTGSQDGDKGDQEEDEAPPPPRIPTVRSGLPFTPSTPSRGTTIPETEPAPEAESARTEAEAEPAAGEKAEAAGAEAATDDEHEGADEPDDTDEHDGAEEHEEPERPLRTGPSDPELSEEPPLELAPELGGEHPHISYVLHVNSVDRPVNDAWIGESLLYVLRERLGLAGAKDGCSQGECGACSVQVDGRLVASCLVPAATAAGSEIRTVEGLAADGVPSDVQRALAESGAVQCGFCVPGLAMTVHDLLEGNHAPSELETRKAICGNLCRCSGYRGVLDAVRTVVEERAENAEREQAAAEAEAEAEAEAYEQGAYQQPGYEQSGYEQGAYGQGGYEQPGFDQGGYHQAEYDQPGYEQGAYGQGGVHIPQQQGPHRPGPDGGYSQQGGAV